MTADKGMDNVPPFVFALAILSILRRTFDLYSAYFGYALCSDHPSNPMKGTPEESVSLRRSVNHLQEKLTSTFLASVFVLVGCIAAFAQASDPQPPQFRLPSTAAPKRYQVSLRVAPD